MGKVYVLAGDAFVSSYGSFAEELDFGKYNERKT
jgi:hypothetical protein